jgi:hypothetical protein
LDGALAAEAEAGVGDGAEVASDPRWPELLDLWCTDDIKELAILAVDPASDVH